MEVSEDHNVLVTMIYTHDSNEIEYWMTQCLKETFKNYPLMVKPLSPKCPGIQSRKFRRLSLIAQINN
jgi:hypothetical protein